MAGEDDHEGGWGTVHRRAGTGDDLSRILSLSDGIFAFAMTLLVIQLMVPSALCANLNPSSLACSGAVSGYLGGERTAFFGYILTFLIIGLWWTSHMRVFRFVKRFDGSLVWLNLLFLLTIAVSPFVLAVYQAYSDTRVAVVLFSAVESVSGLLLAALWWHAQREHLVGPNADPQVVKYLNLRTWLSPLAFVVSIPIGFVVPSLAAYVWLGCFVPFILLRRKLGG